MENQDEHDCTRDVGRLINTLSHQLKRQISFPEEESSLTNIQRLVLNYILFQVLKGTSTRRILKKNFRSGGPQQRRSFSFSKEKGLSAGKRRSGMRVSKS